MLQVEQVLHGRYQLQQKLGQNAGRQTWLAVDLAAQPPERVIVKLLAFSGGVEWDDLKLFEREAQVLKQLNHPRIPKYRDYFCVDDRWLWFGLVQEYIPGSSLKEWLGQGKRLTETQVRKIAVDVLNILIDLHEASPPLLHRDIKPSNLILAEDQQVYLVDFGAVQDRAAAEGATFTVVGTYGYTPMEQFGGRAVPASDLYALGATLIHLVTGTEPADLPQRDLRIQFSDRTSLSPSFVRWLQGLVEPAVEKRCSSARQALEALQSNHTPSSWLTVHQPTGSRIQLKKSASRLKIEIPGPGIRGIQLPALKRLLVRSGMTAAIFLPAVYVFPNPLVFLVPVPLFFMLWTIGIDVLSDFLLPALGQTHVHFHSEYFQIEWKVLGLLYRRQQGKISDIQDVCGSVEVQWKMGKPSEQGKELIQGVVIQESKNYIPVDGSPSRLTEAESRWLIQEIKAWLGLK